MNITNELRSSIEEGSRRCDDLKVTSQYEDKNTRLQSLAQQLALPTLWDDPENAARIGQEHSVLQEELMEVDQLVHDFTDIKMLFDLAMEEEHCDETMNSIASDLTQWSRRMSYLEFQCMFSGEMDANNAFLTIQAGSGGTEAQDWAEMLLRMYLRYCEQRNFDSEILSLSPGEVAGVKHTTIKIDGKYVYGWMRTEAGVHRLVRKSPFDSGNRRHTSFAAVSVVPEIDDKVEIHIDTNDLRIDTYRASGAGGQHVNKTDSAVRVTHLPTGLVVQCQNQRSQHQNRENAMRQLRAKLYDLEIQKRTSEREARENEKTAIGWGNQIRSYVLDSAMIKDLRTGVKTTHCSKVLDGDIGMFLEASLKQRL